MMKNYSMELANGVKAFLDEDDWKYSFDKEKGMFRFGLKIKSRLSQIQYMVRVHEKHITFYGIAPVSPDHEDEKMMGQMAEFICKANYGLKNGCFEMDYNDGEIRYKSYVDCDGIIPSQKVIENSIYCIANMYETYAPGIIDILFKDVPAKEAIEKCEDGRRRPRELLRQERAIRMLFSIFCRESLQKWRHLALISVKIRQTQMTRIMMRSSMM